MPRLADVATYSYNPSVAGCLPITREQLTTLVGDVLVTGQPGAGKTTLTRHLVERGRASVDLDIYGSTINGEWIIPLNALQVMWARSCSPLCFW